MKRKRAAKKPTKKYTSILLEVEELTKNVKQTSYGHPFDNFKLTAKLWEPIIGILLTPQQVAMCMIQFKIARELHKPKRDNRIDMIGYVKTLDQVMQRREELDTMVVKQLKRMFRRGQSKVVRKKSYR